MDGHGRDPDGAGHPHHAASSGRAAATTTTTRPYRPELPGIDRVRGPGRPPAALARGPRHDRQAGRRGRQRRHRHDARPGARRRRGRARHDAAALADVRPRAAGRRPGRRACCAAGCPSGVATGSPAGRTSASRSRRSSSASERRARPSGSSASAAAKQLPEGYPVDVALQADVRPLGPAAVPGARRRPVPGHPRGQRRRRHRHHRHVHRRRRAGARRASCSPPTSWSRRPGSSSRSWAACHLHVDGEEVDLRERMAYRALMLGGVPNFVFTIGYTNASWTLKADLVADYVCRLLAHLDEHGYRTVVAGARPGRRRGAVHGLHAPATCCARCTCCPSRATGSRGGCGRTTCYDVRSIRRGPARRRHAAFRVTGCPGIRRFDRRCPTLVAAARPVLPRVAARRPIR